MKRCIVAYYMLMSKRLSRLVVMLASPSMRPRLGNFIANGVIQGNLPKSLVGPQFIQQPHRYNMSRSTLFPINLWAVATHIIDRYSGYHWIFFSYSKTEIFQSFQIWIEYIEGQTVLQVQIIQIDDGTEFCPKEIHACCEKKGIAYRPIVPLSSEMNGPIEKAGRWIMDLARTTLLQRNCPQSDWPYAEAAAVHVINFIPSDRNPNGECPHKGYWSAEEILESPDQIR